MKSLKLFLQSARANVITLGGIPDKLMKNTFTHLWIMNVSFLAITFLLVASWSGYGGGGGGGGRGIYLNAHIV